MANEGLKIREGRIDLIAEHAGREINFVYPASGPGTYADVRSKISEGKLKMPAMSETASLVYAAWQNPDEKYSKEIINLLKNKWLLANNGILLAKKGVYVQDNPPVKDGKIVMDEKALEKKLSNCQYGIMKSCDESIRFTEYGFDLESQKASDLAKNRFVIVLAGTEGAEKLAKTAEKYPSKPYVFGSNRPDENNIRVAALVSDYNGSGLVVYGYYFDDWSGFAFGVSKTGEASLRKK